MRESMVTGPTRDKPSVTLYSLGLQGQIHVPVIVSRLLAIGRKLVVPNPTPHYCSRLFLELPVVSQTARAVGTIQGQCLRFAVRRTLVVPMASFHSRYFRAALPVLPSRLQSQDKLGEQLERFDNCLSYLERIPVHPFK
jgi:hypothetical protein